MPQAGREEVDVGGHEPLRSLPRVVLGLFLIGLGALFFLDNLKLVDARALLVYWPAVFILIGLAKAVRPREGGWRGDGLIWILIGCWMLAERLGILRVRFRDVWPALLMLVGLRLLWRGSHSRRPRPDSADGGASVQAAAIMSGVTRRNNSAQFTGGDLTAVMGGCEIDLRQAQIEGAEATIDTFAFWGGIEIRVPETWSVTSQVMPILGGFSDSTRPPATPGPRLVVTGMAIMGGVEVKN